MSKQKNYGSLTEKQARAIVRFGNRVMKDFPPPPPHLLKQMLKQR